MKCNMGTLDRSIRGILGSAVIVAGVYYQSWWGVLGVLPLSSSLFAWCPFYFPFGISSCSIEDNK